MSDVKRYWLSTDGMREARGAPGDIQGEWVRAEDYDRLAPYAVALHHELTVLHDAMRLCDGRTEPPYHKSTRCKVVSDLLAKNPKINAEQTAPKGQAREMEETGSHAPARHPHSEFETGDEPRLAATCRFHADLCAKGHWVPPAKQCDDCPTLRHQSCTQPCPDCGRQPPGPHCGKVVQRITNVDELRIDTETVPACLQVGTQPFRAAHCCPCRITCESVGKCEGLCPVRCRPGSEFQVVSPPPGWKLVPIEPTRDMLYALGNLRKLGQWAWQNQQAWAAMLEAAPSCHVAGKKP